MSIKFVQLGEVTTLQAGIGFPLNLQGRKNGLFPFAKVGDISRCGRTGNSILTTADHYVDQVDVDSLRAKPVPVGSILFAKIGEAIRQNHRVVTGCRMLIDNNAMAAIPGEKINGRFLYHFLKTVDFYCLAPATTVPALRKSDLERLPIPLPPLTAQRRIAVILDQADALRAKRREALAQLDSLTQSIFIEMFGDPVSNPKDWPRVRFATLLENIDSGWSPVCMDHAAQDDEWGVLKLGAVTSCTYNDSENKALPEGVAFDPKIEVKPGDLLFSRKNTYHLVAACVLVGESRERLMLSDLIFRFRLNSDSKVEKQYLQSLLVFPSKRSEVQKLAGGSSGSMPNISKGRLLELDIELPPLSVQQIYSARIQSIDALKATHRTSLTELDSLFASLQHRAFRGEL